MHEVGHALHTLAARVEPLVFLHHAPLEFCEVASMSVELLAAEHLEPFYDPDDAARALRQHLEVIIRLLPWVATIDQFQHWLYTHPGHTAAQRTDAWLAISQRFTSSMVDWTGLQATRESYWQRQLHLFHHPFYYIEYGIAQLGALGVWCKVRQEGSAAMRQLHAALTLGGTQPLPALFQAAGIRFDFSAHAIEPLVRQLADELDRLPD
jgi:oligoendopeptidase F